MTAPSLLDAAPTAEEPATHCRRCGQPVHRPESVARRIGPKCWAREHPPAVRIARPSADLAGQDALFDLPEGETVTHPTTYIQDAFNVVDAALPGQDPDLIRLYTLLALAKGEDTTLEDVHDAWALWRTTTRPDHPAIIPFRKLARETQELDREYVEGIHKAARDLGRELRHG